MIKVCLLGVFILGLMMSGSGQDKNADIPTNNVTHKRVNHRKHQPKIKNYNKLYKKSTRKTMYGNPCAIDVTHKMGFEYVPLAQGKGKTKMGLLINNTFVKSKLCLTRTPFWKMILNKRLKDCRLKSGDGIG